GAWRARSSARRRWRSSTRTSTPGARPCRARCSKASIASAGLFGILLSKTMAKKDKHVSETPATQWLRAQGIPFTEHIYDYVEHGGTAESSKQLGVPESEVVKTLVMQDELGRPLIVLMHGDRQVSTKSLA